MKTGYSIRGIATVLLLLSLAMPLSRCERTSYEFHESEKGTEIRTIPIEPPQYTYQYAVNWFSLTDWTGWVALLTFIWPLVFLLCIRPSSRKWEYKSVHLAEMLCCLGGGYVIWGLSSSGERLIGAYVALCATLLYFLAAVRDILHPRKRKPVKTF